MQPGLSSWTTTPKQSPTVPFEGKILTKFGLKSFASKF